MSTSGNIQEVMVKQGEKNMRLLINHTHCHLRFMDFRVGNYDDKRDILDAAAEEHNLRKVFTLVEKQDSSSWRGAGFLREGVYPSFFRTADAYVMSRIYDDDGIPCTPSAPIPRTPVELETVDSLGKLDKIRTKMTERVPEVAAFMEELKVPLRLIPFGRTIHPDVVMRAWLRNKEGWACAEIDESFGHAVLAFTPHPESIPDMRLSVAAAEQLRVELEPRGVNNMFGISPEQDSWLAQMFNALNFKVTGRLLRHLTVNGEASNALVWHKRFSDGKK